MSDMKQYSITLTGQTPILMHSDNIPGAERLAKWRKDPANKKISQAGDDRTPAWTWTTYVYHDGHEIGIPSDNLMTMLREGGAKVTRSGKSTFKKETQAGIIMDQQQFRLLVNGKPISIEPIRALVGNNDFSAHLDLAESLGFELLVKRAAIGRAKHIRVRPMFREWVAVGSMTVLNEEQSGLTSDILQTIWTQAGAFVGICDWRPSSGASGTFGRFTATVEAM